MLCVAALNSGDLASLVRAVAGGLVLGALYLIAILVPRIGMGRGDGQPAVVIGLCLGCISSEAIVVATAAAVLLAGASVAGQLTARHVDRTDLAPSSPYQLLGALAALLITA